MVAHSSLIPTELKMKRKALEASTKITAAQIN